LTNSKADYQTLADEKYGLGLGAEAKVEIDAILDTGNIDGQIDNLRNKLKLLGAENVDSLDFSGSEESLIKLRKAANDAYSGMKDGAEKVFGKKSRKEIENYTKSVEKSVKADKKLKDSKKQASSAANDYS
jgi:hypothetical protein